MTNYDQTTTFISLYSADWSSKLQTHVINRPHLTVGFDILTNTPYTWSQKSP